MKLIFNLVNTIFNIEITEEDLQNINYEYQK